MRRHFYLISRSNLHEELSEKLPKMFLIKSCCSFRAATRISAVLNGAWLLTVRTAHYERIMLSPSNFFLPHICINMSVWDQPGGVEIRFAAQLKCFSFFSFLFLFHHLVLLLLTILHPETQRWEVLSTNTLSLYCTNVLFY